MQTATYTKIERGKYANDFDEPERVLWFYSRGYLDAQQSALFVMLSTMSLSLVLLALGLFQPQSEFNYSKPIVYLSVLVLVPIAMKMFRKEFYRLYPLVLVAYGYELISLLQFYLTIPPNTTVLYQFDKLFFSWMFGGELPSFFFYENHKPAWDIFFGLVYFSQTIIPIFLYLYYRITENETVPILFWGVCYIGITAVLLFTFFPTAAPWFVYNYGFDPANITKITPETATAGLWFTDQALGSNFFVSFYWSNTQAKFAAFPSLHVGIPASLYFYSRERNLSFKTFNKYYVLLMMFTIVYLNHHWVADGLAGLLIAYLATKLSSRQHKPMIEKKENQSNPLPSISKALN